MEREVATSHDRLSASASPAVAVPDSGYDIRKSNAAQGGRFFLQVVKAGAEVTAGGIWTRAGSGGAALTQEVTTAPVPPTPAPQEGRRVRLSGPPAPG